MMDYMTVKEEKWGITPQKIDYLCAAGVFLARRIW